MASPLLERVRAIVQDTPLSWWNFVEESRFPNPETGSIETFEKAEERLLLQGFDKASFSSVDVPSLEKCQLLRFRDETIEDSQAPTLADIFVWAALDAVSDENIPESEVRAQYRENLLAAVSLASENLIECNGVRAAPEYSATYVKEFGLGDPTDILVGQQLLYTVWCEIEIAGPYEEPIPCFTASRDLVEFQNTIDRILTEELTLEDEVEHLHMFERVRRLHKLFQVQCVGNEEEDALSKNRTLFGLLLLLNLGKVEWQQLENIHEQSEVVLAEYCGHKIHAYTWEFKREIVSYLSTRVTLAEAFHILDWIPVTPDERSNCRFGSESDIEGSLLEAVPFAILNSFNRDTSEHKRSFITDFERLVEYFENTSRLGRHTFGMLYPHLGICVSAHPLSSDQICSLQSILKHPVNRDLTARVADSIERDAESDNDKALAGCIRNLATGFAEEEMQRMGLEVGDHAAMFERLHRKEPLDEEELRLIMHHIEKQIPEWLNSEVLGNWETIPQQQVLFTLISWGDDMFLETWIDFAFYNQDLEGEPTSECNAYTYLEECGIDSRLAVLCSLITDKRFETPLERKHLIQLSVLSSAFGTKYVEDIILISGGSGARIEFLAQYCLRHAKAMSSEEMAEVLSKSSITFDDQTFTWPNKRCPWKELSDT